MLQIIRDQVKGWVAVLIFTIMIIPFAFWGINYYFDQSGGVVALDVNGEEISLAAYQRAYQDMRQRWQSVSGAPLSAETEPLVKQQVIEDLIQFELLHQAAQKAGLYVGDQDVWQAVRQLPTFHDANGFNISLFELAANRNNLTPAGLLDRIRQDMVVGQLRNAVLATDFVTQPEIAGYSALLHQTRDFSYAVLSSDELKEAIEPTAEEIQAYYELEGRFMEPERVRIAYLVLSLAMIAEKVYLEDGELEAWFDENRQDYEVEETRKVKQILLNLPAEPAAETVEKLRKRARELYELLSQGKAWEDMVANHTGEDAEAVEFSEFGFLAKGAMEAEVDEVVFSLEVGEVSEPVRSRLGFHIMAVDEIKAGVEATLADVRETAEQDLREEKAAQQLYDLTDRLTTLTYENPDTLEVAAEELGLEVHRSDYLSREESGAGIVAEPSVVLAAFSDDVLLGQNNSNLLELDNDRYMVLRSLEHRPPVKKDIEEVRAEIVTRLKYEGAREQAMEQGGTILAALQQGKSREELASTYSLDWETATGVTRDDSNINRAVLRAAFKAGIPEDIAPVYEGVSLGTGDYVIVILYAVTKANAGTPDPGLTDAVRAQLMQASTTSTWQEFTAGLRENADVTVYEEVL